MGQNLHFSLEVWNPQPGHAFGGGPSTSPAVASSGAASPTDRRTS